MIIFGVDPGLASTGYGVIQYKDQICKVVDYGTIVTPANTPLPKRLLSIYETLRELINHHQPAFVIIEELFFANNALTVMGVAQARGVAVLAACQPGIVVAEYTPLQVKQAVTGSGRADKNQVHQMVNLILNLGKESGKKRTAHESDALALALCHAHGSRISALRCGETSVPPRIKVSGRRRK